MVLTSMSYHSLRETTQVQSYFQIILVAALSYKPKNGKKKVFIRPMTVRAVRATDLRDKHMISLLSRPYRSK